MNGRSLLKVTTILILAFSLVACGARLQGNVLTIPVTISEDMVNRLVQETMASHINVGGDSFLAEITNLEFIEPNTIRVNGTHVSDAGNSTPGSLDLAFSAVDRKLRVAIAAIDIPGLNMDSEPVQKANQALTDAFGKAALENNLDAGIASAEIKGKTLEIILEVPLSR
jgi:hypothetical protein